MIDFITKLPGIISISFIVMMFICCISDWLSKPNKDNKKSKDDDKKSQD